MPFACACERGFGKSKSARRRMSVAVHEITRLGGKGTATKRAKGTFWMRFSILLLAGVFGVLVYWSAAFLLDDIRVFRLPDREAFS